MAEQAKGNRSVSGVYSEVVVLRDLDSQSWVSFQVVLQIRGLLM